MSPIGHRTQDTWLILKNCLKYLEFKFKWLKYRMPAPCFILLHLASWNGSRVAGFTPKQSKQSSRTPPCVCLRVLPRLSRVDRDDAQGGLESQMKTAGPLSVWVTEGWHEGGPLLTHPSSLTCSVSKKDTSTVSEL